MKITQVEYKRLFNLGNYENETIGFIAEIPSGEEKKAIAKLCGLVFDLHNAIAKLKKLKEKIDIIYYTEGQEGYYGTPTDSILYKANRIREYKEYIKEEKERIKEAKGELEKLQAEKQLEQYKIRLKKTEKELQETKELGEKLRDIYQRSMKSFKEGDLSFLDEFKTINL
ncbi:MAG TPA: hypothetical protein ENI51_10250 [Candidatus Atribacteria bacterium]|nr:hypothetical protein [Candidatus Atribacteria bacterium]